MLYFYAMKTSTTNTDILQTWETRVAYICFILHNERYLETKNMLTCLLSNRISNTHFENFDTRRYKPARDDRRVGPRNRQALAPRHRLARRPDSTHRRPDLKGEHKIRLGSKSILWKLFLAIFTTFRQMHWWFSFLKRTCLFHFLCILIKIFTVIG
jgi:hypothetical protein